MKKTIEESKSSGVQAFFIQEKMPLYPKIQNEEVYLAEKRKEYLEKSVHKQQNGIFYLFMALLWGSLLLMNVGFITKKGYYFLGAKKPQKLLVRCMKNYLAFYLESVQPEKPLFMVADNPENRAMFAPLMKYVKRRKVKCYVRK